MRGTADICVKALLFLALLLQMGAADARRKPGATKLLTRAVRESRVACARRGVCPNDRHFENCLNRCVSEPCYVRVYGNEPLEEGEVDYTRSRAFLMCLREFEGTKRRLAQNGPIQGGRDVEAWQHDDV